MKHFSIKRIAFVAIFAAISSLLYCYVKFPLPIFPSFLDVNFSMIPIIIAAFMLGPIDGVIIVLIRFLMKLILVGTGTQYVGEIADLVLGLVTTVCRLVHKLALCFRFKSFYFFCNLRLILRRVNADHLQISAVFFKCFCFFLVADSIRP